jgi:formylglycine-generating enzyme required for sulfatase activity
MRLAGCLGVITVLLAAGPAVPAEGPGLPPEKPAGSGVIVHPDGYILTARHVLADARRIVVVTPGEFRAPAVVVSADPEHDLALLKIETIGLSEAPLGYASEVKLDQEVLLLGFSFGLREVSVARGRIAAIRTKGVRRVLQVDAAVNPGNSGGPLFNGRGELIGILTTKFSHPSGLVPEGMAFAVPISYATPLLANIPDYDFAAIGRGRGEAATGAGVPVEALVRTAVRIEVARGREPAPAPPGPAAGLQPAEAHPAPAVGRERGLAPDRAAADPRAVEVAPGNGRPAELQQAELRRLAERGVAAPEGMVLIPAGDFLMGDEDGLPDARPPHRVHLSAYWIDRYEVTNERYRACVEAGVCAPPRAREAFDDPRAGAHPVTNVTWLQARTYCHWRGARLPTEAEWEKAARGPDARRYPWGDDEGPIQRGRHDGAGRTTEPVGSRPDAASPYGVQDLVGSVWEWVKDWYAEDYYGRSPARDPQGPLRGSFRVLRGGDWTRGAVELRVSARAWDEMTYWGPTLGFRCAADAP